jgi:hypothetical protein
MSDSVRWTVKVSSETDRLLRSFLGAQGMKKGDLSRFVEDAVRWRVLDETVRTIRERNRGLPAEALQDEIDRAVREARNELQAATD